MNMNQKRKIRRVIPLTILSLLAVVLAAPSSLFAAELPVETENLKGAIEQKARQLEEVTKQLQQVQGELSDVTVQGKTLKAEVNRIDETVKKVNLNIKVSEITIDKLGLEVRSLQDEISDKERSVDFKREAVSQLLQAYQQRERESLLLTFLSGETLSEGLLEVQNISDFNDGLLREVNDLRALKQDLVDQLDEVSGKKQSVEQESVNLKAKKSIAQDQLTNRQHLLVETKNKEENYKKIVSDLEKQQQSISDEISDIEEKLRAEYGNEGVPLARPGVLSKPVKSGILTQLYGRTKDAAKLYKSGFHNGIDYGFQSVRRYMQQRTVWSLARLTMGLGFNMGAIFSSSTRMGF